jgi:conjugative relaxase-like TrwC/TraI family protein
LVASFAIIRSPSYYTKGAAADYYQSGADSGGVWLRGNSRLGVKRGASVDPKLFESLCAGLGPDGGVLVKGAGPRGRVAGIDLTLSCPKSVSVLWAIGDPHLRAEIAAAEQEAVEATLQFIEQEIPLARRGGGGKRREGATFVAAVYTHMRSRGVMPRPASTPWSSANC